MAKTTTKSLALVEGSIPESIRVIEEQLKKFKHIQESVYKTKCKLETTDGEIDIKTETSVKKLVDGLSNVIIRREGIEKAYEKLGISKYPVVKIDGDTEEDIIADIKLRIQIIEQKDTMDKLAALKKEAEELMDKEDRKALFQKKLESFLDVD